jgi:hypothetical protein
MLEIQVHQKEVLLRFREVRTCGDLQLSSVAFYRRMNDTMRKTRDTFGSFKITYDRDSLLRIPEVRLARRETSVWLRTRYFNLDNLVPKPLSFKASATCSERREKSSFLSTNKMEPTSFCKQSSVFLSFLMMVGLFVCFSWCSRVALEGTCFYGCFYHLRTRNGIVALGKYCNNEKSRGDPEMMEESRAGQGSRRATVRSAFWSGPF